MRKISADSIFIDNAWEKDKAVIVADDGNILDIIGRSTLDNGSVEDFSGSLIPGFINTHCHLELSHMKGIIPTGTGLIPFITKVVQLRAFPDEEIQEAIANADEEMYQNGIQAVGDISNKLDTASVKAESRISYYSFVELFDFMVDRNASFTFNNARNAYDGHSLYNGNKKSLVPHAPYSVSRSLFDIIRRENKEGATISIHNQETVHENNFFLKKQGDFIEFFKGFNIDISEFSPTHKSSIHYAMANMDPAQKTLFVHNTMTNREDIKAAHKWSKHVYWATCANANLYIENKLPDYAGFMEEGAKMTIGTDSLSSNWQLSVFEEIQTIKKYNSEIPYRELVKWATINGAEALSYDEKFGSIEKGKRPGIVHISEDLSVENVYFPQAKCQRII